ncbi:egg cell-secreted protein 1.3-like [Mercurialis annua]|uniref:egg cell-secreted protein 1.3-like n=1 Tax=Mercurialis annua TaxID=3986 RepID=UPI00215DD9BC|nr:egg cell-secreted protein 1.3-like [Mercurialis annua]
MASNLQFTVLIIASLLAATLSSTAMAARPLARASGSGSSLMARLKLDEESANCWDSLIQLQACSTEIILFFLNGETELGHGCCHAIRIISEQCWPNLIDTLGFTTEEGDILEGYCIKEEDGTSTPPPSPPSPVYGLPKVVLEQNLVPLP